MDMKIKSIIKKYLIEESNRKDKIFSLIKKQGLFNAIRIVGGYDSFGKIMGGYDDIDINLIIDFIEDFADDFEDSISVADFGINPIITRDEDGELCQIETLYPTGVGIACYGGYKYGTELDFLVMNYYDLDESIVREIFEGIMWYIEEL